jgi:hypothetical protein
MRRIVRIAAASLISLSLPAVALAPAWAQDAKDQPPKDQAGPADPSPKDQPAATPPASTPPAPEAAAPATPTPPTTPDQPNAPVPGNPNLTVATVKMDGGIRASKLIGASVTGANNQDLGTINDLVLDHDGKIVLGVISVGSVLGMGGKLVAEPFGQFQLGNNGKLTLPSASKDELTKQPGFTYSDQ